MIPLQPSRPLSVSNRAPRFPPERGDDSSPVSRLPWEYAGAERNRWRLGDHDLRRSWTGGVRCLGGRGVHRGRRYDGAAPFGRRPRRPVRDPSGDPGPGPRSCGGAPNAGNIDVSLPTGARSDRPVAISCRSIVPTQAWSSNPRPRRSTLGCEPSSRVSAVLWAAPAGTAARREGPARTSQKATRAGWYGGPHTALTPGGPAVVVSLPELLRRMEHRL